jgi:hypothetical protein
MMISLGGGALHHGMNKGFEDFEIEDDTQMVPALGLERNRFWSWIQGPVPPRDETPKISHPLLVRWEQWPYQLRHRFPHRARVLVLYAYFALWFIINYAILHPHLITGPLLNGESGIVSLSCTGDHYLWQGKNQLCGPDGSQCLNKNEDIIVKCPALCDRGWIYSATPVGTEMVKYRQFAIGGGRIDGEDEVLTKPYRGDSSPCSSAVHGGLLSPFFGGCVKLKLTGEQWSFESRKGPYGTGWSVAFPSFFPSSFVFSQLPDGLSGCYDPRLVIMAVNFLMGAPVIYLASGAIGFWTSALAGFWTILLVLDPPFIVNPQWPRSTAELVSNGFAKMLPLCFVLYTLWTTSVERTLAEGSPLAKLFLWYPLFWVGSANSITFDRIPIDRLTVGDIKEMPGSIIAIVIVIPLIILCVVVQAVQIWRSGRLLPYFKWYSVMILVLITLALLPNLELRIHHYILGLFLIPGTSTRGYTAYVLQGLLLGLILSGIARWDFASIVETHVSLLRGEAGASPVPPSNLTFNGTHILWDKPENRPDKLLGFSLIVNDVESYVGEESSIDIHVLINDNEYLQSSLEKVASIPLFFRVAISSTDPGSLERGDYTRAGVLDWPSGKWQDPEPGMS